VKALIATLVVCASLTGCADHRQVGSEKRPSPSTTPSPTNTAPATSARPSLAPVGWRKVRSVPRSAQAIEVTGNGTYLAYWDDADPDTLSKQQVRVSTAAGRLILEEGVSDPSSFIQDVWLSDHYLVVEEINEAARRVHVVAYDLPSGRVVELPHAARPTQPEMDATGGLVALISGAASTGMCVQIVDLTTHASKKVACRGRGDVLGDVAMAGKEVIFSAVKSPNSPQRCKQIFTASDGRVEEVPLAVRCIGWSGAVTDQAIAWDEMDPASQLMGESVGYIDTGEGPPQELEPMETDTIVACGDDLYWLSQDGRGERIDRRDAGGRIETIWKPKNDLVPVNLRCTDGRWLSMRTDDIDGVDEHLSLYVLDTAAQ